MGFNVYKSNMDKNLYIANNMLVYLRGVIFSCFQPPPEEELRESDLPYTVDPSKFLSLDDLKNGKISKSGIYMYMF